jgi:transcription termination factor NusB
MESSLNRNTEMNSRMVETVYEDYTRLKDEIHPKLTSNLLEYLPAILDALLNHNSKSYKYFDVIQVIDGP